MNPATVGQTIQQILAPVVMVTSCAVLLGGILARYAAIGDRLRIMAHERLDLLRGPEGMLSVREAKADAYKAERLNEIDKQMPDLLRRHGLIHNALLTLYSAILVFIVCMLLLGLAAATHAAPLANLALLVFLVGTCVLAAGLLFIAIEVRVSSTSVHYEATRVLMVGRQ